VFARLWFALSVIWGTLMLLACLNPNANAAGREWMLAFAIAPFALGLLLRWTYRYVVTGRP
jgi:hypothetical protein